MLFKNLLAARISWPQEHFGADWNGVVIAAIAPIDADATKRAGIIRNETADRFYVDVAGGLLKAWAQGRSLLPGMGQKRGAGLTLRRENVGAT